MKKAIINILPILFLVFLLGCGEKNVDAPEINNMAFQQEVLESPVPVLVVFCDDELWNRKASLWSRTQPSPTILAVKEFIREEKYKDEVKFRKYIVPEGSHNEATYSFDKDPLCREFNIKWLPTVIIFNNGSVVKKLEGGGCSLNDSKEAIEGVLKQAGEL